MAENSNANGPAPQRIRVAIVEDDSEIRHGLESMVSSSAGFICVAACPNAEEALVGLPQKQPDVVLMDIGLPGMSGIACIPRLKERLPHAQVMMLTVFDDPDRIFESLKAGATGYLVKKTSPSKLARSIRDLHAGGSPMSSQIARRVVEAFQQPPPRFEAPPQLSEREQDILTRLAQGFLYKEIAEILGISLETVRTHARNIYKKLEVRTRMQAVNKVFPKRK
ncbi:MAG: response regulator transcription factor [Verrucomicrobia subdivision 3 bacterium]|nr:response regulator transcription factor [Limisphaerales bacterium]